jgi:Uma2 family endonuclease
MKARCHPATLTAEELLRLPSPSGERYELIEGVLEVREPPGEVHGWVECNVASLLRAYARRHRLGYVLTGDSGYLTRGDDRTVRAPDVAFLSFERRPPGSLSSGYGGVPPDLVVEVLSPQDRPREVLNKVREWLSFGVTAAWVVDPRRRTVEIHEEDSSRLLGERGVIDGGRAVPGFSAPVREFFEL